METVAPVDPAQEVIRVGDHFYVLALSSRADDRTRVLKHGDTFAVLDRYGDILADRLGDQGLYHEGARHVSRLDTLIDGLRPLLLSSGLDQDNLLLAVDLTNPDLSNNGHITVPRGSVHILRMILIWDGAMHQRLIIHNFGLKPFAARLSIRLAADFADIFEVRGVPRRRPGCPIGTRVENHDIVAEYVGSDHVTRRTLLTCSAAPDRVTPDGLEFDVELAAHQERVIDIAASCRADVAPAAFDEAMASARRRVRTLRDEECEITTSSEAFNQWIGRSMADLRLMTSRTPWGEYPYAGVPWFSTPFGRDGAITALQTVWVDSRIARGVLAFMAATQADHTDAASDAQPGKIFHEFRQGELPATGQVPYARYYGSVDSTPLFVMLAGEYLKAVGDTGFIHSLWPAVQRALEWMDRWGDADGDGFIEYASDAPRGLTNKGWKDSIDSIFCENGALATGSIAVCEVQAYAFAAKRAAAAIATSLGDAASASRLALEADALRAIFLERFWDEGLGLYALALDGAKNRCRVAASNTGHCLFAGIARDDHASRIIDDLLSPRFFSGWGIRTVATDQSRYNPMSYHNGTIWPHDTAIIAAGMARYGRPDAAARILSAMLDASGYAESYRLPELFCGFPRRPGEGPIRYPVACAPQSWAAGAVFLLLQSCLGLSIHPQRREVQFLSPCLPDFLQHIQFRNLRVGSCTVDLVLQKRTGDLGLNILRRDKGVRVVLSH